MDNDRVARKAPLFFSAAKIRIHFFLSPRFTSDDNISDHCEVVRMVVFSPILSNRIDGDSGSIVTAAGQRRNKTKKFDGKGEGEERENTWKAVKGLESRLVSIKHLIFLRSDRRVHVVLVVPPRNLHAFPCPIYNDSEE